jgi:hypothetical protein
VWGAKCVAVDFVYLFNQIRLNLVILVVIAT